MDSLPIYIYLIGLSFFSSIVVFFRDSSNYLYLKLFTPFLFLTLLAELLGFYLGSIGKHNAYVYNFFSTFEFCFYLWVLSLIIQNRYVRKAIRIIIVLYILIAVANILFIQKVTKFHTVTYSLGCLLIVSFCIYYFFELFKFLQPVKLQNNPAFWICSGLLFFYCCGFPLYGLINSWASISTLVVYNFEKIVTILNIFLYSLFTIAFLCTKKKNYTSSPS